jgi:hypothetical protein
VPNHRLNGWVLPADEWSKLPKMVGTEFRLKVHQAADLVVSEQRMKVFQYYANVEGNLCSFAPVEDFGFFTISKAIPVACYGVEDGITRSLSLRTVGSSERMSLLGSFH